MEFIRIRWANILILCIAVVGIWLRASIYGDFRLSIGMPDTPTYIDSSKAVILSAQAFTGRRPITTNFLYKIANDPKHCELPTISSPATGIDAQHRSYHACFDKIVLLQNLISVAGWCFLALTTARWLKQPLYRVSAVILILTFGYTPQIAEWDSVLSSESLSLSMFPIVFALLQEAVLRIANHRHQQYNLINRLFIPAWMTILVVWVFLRDVQLYSLAVTLALLIPLLLVRQFRTDIIFPLIAITLVGILIFGSSTAHNSTRWQPSLTHILEAYIFPYPSRIEYFTDQLQMPEHQNSDEYVEWFDAQGVKAWGKFLVAHPGFVISTIIEKSDYFKSDFIQPYFKTSEVRNRNLLLVLGEAVHPETNAVYLIDAMLLISVYITAIKYRDATSIAWAWLATWLFAYAVISLLFSFFGDTDGTRRHIFPSVELLRLFLWLFLFRTLDSLSERVNQLSKQSNGKISLTVS